MRRRRPASRCLNIDEHECGLVTRRFRLVSFVRVNGAFRFASCSSTLRRHSAALNGETATLSGTIGRPNLQSKTPTGSHSVVPPDLRRSVNVRDDALTKSAPRRPHPSQSAARFSCAAMKTLKLASFHCAPSCRACPKMAAFPAGAPSEKAGFTRGLFN